VSADLVGNGLDDVRVQCALQQVVDGAAHSLDLTSLVLEHVDEEPADGLALHLGVRHALEPGEEELGGVYDGEVDAQCALEPRFDLDGLVFAQAAVVHHDGVEAVADGALQQHRRDR
jgi:hypothetical protein